jgi:hypothetical protein
MFIKIYSLIRKKLISKKLTYFGIRTANIANIVISILKNSLKSFKICRFDSILKFNLTYIQFIYPKVYGFAIFWKYFYDLCN